MSQLDQLPGGERNKMAEWKAPGSQTAPPPDASEAQNPQALAEKILSGSKANAAQVTEREGKPGWDTYENRLAVAERNWISLSMGKINDPAVLEILQQRMGEIDRQFPDMIDETLHSRAIRDNSSETYRAALDRSKAEAAKILADLPTLEAQLQTLNPADTIIIKVDVSGGGGTNRPTEISTPNPAVAQAIDNFLKRCASITVPGTAFRGTTRADQIKQAGNDSENAHYNMKLMWIGGQNGDSYELRTTAPRLIAMLKTGLKSAQNVKNPYQ